MPGVRLSHFLACFASVFLSAFCVSAQSLSDLRDAYERPRMIPMPSDAPYSPQIATLGKMLFFDPRLSDGQNISCSSCHNPSFGWEAPVDAALGAANTRLGRHAPTIVNAAWLSPLFWDGRAHSLEEQALGPILAPDEMNSDMATIIDRLSRVEEYRFWFDALFPDQGMSEDTILRAIATYERTIVAGWSDFDHWVEGDERAISQSAKRGFNLFNGKAGCANCHNGWNFTDNEFHRIGIPSEDLGRGAIDASNPQNRYSFKTPGLRNIMLRAPYMHNGAFTTIEDVIRHYASGGVDLDGAGTDLRPFEISNDEIDDLVSFLETLSDENASVPAPILPSN